MKIHILRFALLPLCALLFQFCDEPSHIVDTRQTVEPPPAPIPTNVQLAVGNSYHWRYTRISSYGNIFQWDETYSITGETVIGGKNYFTLSTGEKLRVHGDTVFAYAYGSESIYYRLNASVGQTVPFLGNTLAVTFIDTSAVLGENQKIITVSSQSLSSGGLDQARYAGKFGLIGKNTSEATSATLGVLIGARVGTTQYGQ